MKNNISGAKKNEFLPHLIIIGTFCFLLSQTWLKWNDLIIDTGSALLLPAELLKGKLLYKDVASLYGFLPQYLIAAIYYLFGISINTLAYIGITLTLITAFTIYRIARFFLEQELSTLLVVNFLIVFAFGNYINCCIFNYIIPYTFAATFFMTFIALALYFFLKYIFFGSNNNLAYWSIFLTAAFLLSGVILAKKMHNPERIKALGYIFSPLLLALLCYGLFFLATHTFQYFKEGVIGAIKALGDTPASRKWAGTENITLSLLQISRSFFIHIGIIIVLVISCLTGNIITPIITAFVLFIALKQFGFYGIQYNCVTLILPCGLAACLLQTLNRCTSTKRDLGILTLFSVSLLTIFRIFLATSPYFLGFSLLALPLICYYIFFGDLLSGTLKNYLKISNGLVPAAIAFFFMLMIIPFWEYSSNAYRHYNVPISTAKGNLYCHNDIQTNIFWKTVDYLKKNTPKDSTVAVLPEGVGINFFSERDSPVKYHHFHPAYIKIFGEDKMLAEMKRAKIDYVVITTRNTSDFGPTSFGIDYAKKIEKWIDDNYIPIKQFGAKPYTADPSGILVLKRRH